MGLILLATGIALVILPGLARPLGRHLAPDQWAWLCALGLGIGAASLWVGTALYAGFTVFGALGVPGLASACERMLGDLAPGGMVAGWVATAAGVAMALMTGIG